MKNTIEQAIEALKNGEFILLYDFDDREGETDFAIMSRSVTPNDILTMRKDGGGLICTAVSSEIADSLGLPYISDALGEGCLAAERVGDSTYDPDNKSAFSYWINHRSTKTGITDIERAKTTNELYKIGKQFSKTLPHFGEKEFAEEFKTPGHCATLRAHKFLLDKRQGQTELSIALAVMANETPVVTICEMLDDNTGKALNKEDAMKYAEKYDLVFLEGKQVVEAFKSFVK